MNYITRIVVNCSWCFRSLRSSVRNSFHRHAGRARDSNKHMQSSCDYTERECVSYCRILQVPASSVNISYMQSWTCTWVLWLVKRVNMEESKWKHGISVRPECKVLASPIDFVCNTLMNNSSELSLSKYAGCLSSFCQYFPSLLYSFYPQTCSFQVLYFQFKIVWGHWLLNKVLLPLQSRNV